MRNRAVQAGWWDLGPTGTVENVRGLVARLKLPVLNDNWWVTRHERHGPWLWQKSRNPQMSQYESNMIGYSLSAPGRGQLFSLPVAMPRAQHVLICLILPSI